jgi:nickel transport protein
MNVGTYDDIGSSSENCHSRHIIPLRRLSAVPGVFLFLVCFLISTAHAHKVNIFAYAEDGRVHAEGYFVDGSKCKNSVVEVIDNRTGEKLLEGRTDGNGQYSFEIPGAAELKLILNAGAGHRNEYVLSQEEIRGALASSKKSPEKDAMTKRTDAPEPEPMRKSSHGFRRVENQQFSAEEMEALVERVVDSKLEPVIRMLAKLQEESSKPGITEIVGGIGYIIGIVGIIGYLKGRSARRKNRTE